MLAVPYTAWLLVALGHCGQALHTSVDVVYRELARGERPHALPHRAYASDNTALLPEVDKQGFWFANFTIGAAHNYEMLIDTGSSDVYVNIGEYQPGPQSKDQNKTFEITFLTTKPNGSGSLTLKGELYDDLVASNGLAITNQELGAQKSPKKPVFPQDGLVGFASRQTSAFGGRPWIHSLCAEKKIDQCRFGLAFRTNNHGTQTIGTVDHSKFKGELSVAPAPFEWGLRGDITVGDKLFVRNQGIITDSGTTVVYGPLHTVRKIFNQLGLQTSYTPGRPAYLRAFFPCDKPPTVGFGFPSRADAAKASGPVSKHSKNFNILGKAMAFKNNGNNNCTAALQGMAGGGFGNEWLVGQAFFQGHYVDHNIADGTMGFADLA